MGGSRNAIILIDTDGRVAFWNDGAADMFGYTDAEAIGVEMAELIVPEASRDKHRAAFARFAHSGNDEGSGRSVVAVPALRRSGEVFPAELSVSPVQIAGNRGAVGIVTDVSERAEYEAKLLREIEFQRSVSEILRVSLEPVDLKEKLNRILGLVLAAPGLNVAAKGAIFLTTESNKLELCAQRNLAAPLLEQCAEIPFGYCLCGRAAASAAIVYAQDIDPRHDVRYEDMAPHGHYCAPIRSGTGQVLGVLNTYVSVKHRHQGDEVSFLNTIADTLAGVIENDRVESHYRGLYQAVEQSPVSVVLTDAGGNIE